MASLDGSRSLQGVSDEYFDHVCGPCEGEEGMIEAKQYCGVCSEFLCDPCVKHHRKLPITKNHKIVPAHTVSVSSSLHFPPADSQADAKPLGAITKQVTKVMQDKKIGLLGKHMQSRRDVDIRLDSPISGCAVMPNGDIVLCERGERNSGRLTLFDKSWVNQGNLRIPGIYDVSVVDPNTVVVTVAEKKILQYVQTLPHLQLGRTIQLDSECLFVCVSGDNIYIRCTTSDKRREIRVLGLDGTEKHQVPVDRNSSPWDITLSPSGEKIFFTDLNSNTITCMTVDGRIVYRYKDNNLKGARGVYCDLEDNLFVCGFRSHTVQAITHDGKNGGTLLTSRDGLFLPQCVAYRSIDDELFVGCAGPTHLLVYKMVA